MINSIYIRNFRSIKSFNQSSIGNVFALIGENSGGKSTILDSILIFFGFDELTNLDFHFDTDELSIGLSLDIKDNNIRRLINELEKLEVEYYTRFKNNYNSQNESNRGIDTDRYLKSFKNYFKILFLGSKYKRNINFILKASKDIDKDNMNLEYFVTGDELNTDDFKELKEISIDDPIFKAFKPQIAYIGDERNFKEEKFGEKDTTTNNILNILLKSMKMQSTKVDLESLKEKTVNELTIQELNELLLEKIENQSNSIMERTNKLFKENYNSNDVEIKWNFDNKLYESIDIISRFKLSGDTDVDFLSVGSGTRSIYLLSLLQAYVDFMNDTEIEEDVIFMIEEPEIYLYPKLQNSMANILYEISQKNQTFITTHSGNIVQKFNLNDVFHVERISLKNKKNYTKIQKLESLDLIIETLGFNTYPLINKEYIIFVEGKVDKKEYKKIIGRLYGDDIVEKTLIVPVTGVSNIQVALNLQIIHSTDLKDNILVIRDSDCESFENRKQKTIKELHKTTFGKYTEKELSEIIYCTEASMLECLTMYPEYNNFEYSEDEFFAVYKSFLRDHEEELKSISDNFLDVLYEFNNIEQSLECFRTYYVNKEILNKFEKVTRGFRPIGSITNKDKLKELVPKLCISLDKLYSK